ncbi:MAG: DUF6265 family protein [Bacteroidota bacterium]
MKYLLYFFLLLSVAVGCADESTTEKPTETPPKPTDTVSEHPLEGLSWMVGDWEQAEKDGSSSVETWARVHSDTMRGRAVSIPQDGGDTTLLETLSLVHENGKAFYIPNVPHNGGPVRFEMTQLDRKIKLAVFENPEHDFPQRISYQMLGDSVLLAKISGEYEGRKSTREFRLNKVVVSPKGH